MRDRRSFSALVGGGLLLALFWPVTSGAPAPPLYGPPEAGSEGRAVLEELALLIRGNDGDFPLFTERPLAALAHSTVGERERSFRLFGEVGDNGRRQLLAKIPYGALIEETADRYRIDSLLLAAVVQTESGFDPMAVSPKGAQGLMQLMPVTAQTYGLERPHEPRANVRAGARYLRDLMRRFDDDLELALAAYNAGPAAVRKFRGVPPYRETRHYVRRVLTLYLGYHRALWQEAQLDQLIGHLPAVTSGPTLVAAQRRSAAAAGRAVVAVGALGLAAAQPLAEVADTLAEPLAQLRQSRVAEDQQHDGENDQQLWNAKASEHGYLRGGGMRSGARSFPTASRVLGFSLTDRPAAPPTPAAAPFEPLAAPAPRQTIAKPARASAPPA
jgi:soluble lytic murein transglycosylase-like protein